MAKKDNQQVCFRTSIGGQALMEGILMRGPEKQAIVCRTENGIVEKVEELSFVKDKHPVLGWPFVRGVFTLVDSLAKGMKALTYSASLLPEDQQEEPTKFDLWLEKRLGSEKAEKIVIGSAAVLGVLLALALFIFLPTFIAGLIPGLEGRYTLRSLVEGVIKLAIFLGYLGLVARMKEIKRLFSYHGAEHKTIFCYEKGLPLTVENVRPQSRFHPRCGTSFLLVVIILGLLAGLLIQADNTLLRIALRLLLLPVIIALAYELNRWAGRHDTNIVSRVVTWPGKQLQRLTTAEPDDGMIECAIRAMELVIPEEKGKDAW
ncbi:MAG TPA: DUF1385 domain-containing protein [Candidatus Scatomorpha merdipullorum]|uniref:DUF1385 domain-containing protein n=1 Tax=Candidatus Scatomorpha merdipullorum TaxID=2840927 RepID=A0A9D1FFL2_9FIRM|nr:DUF1385 domain-containing protein [Candidatus Scatomorpha merdipullorum]